MLRIESDSDGQTNVIRLIGRLQAEHVDELKKQLEHEVPRTVLDLEEVTLVDRDVVRFLSVCEGERVELRGCSPYVRDWISREQAQTEEETDDRS